MRERVVSRERFTYVPGREPIRYVAEASDLGFALPEIWTMSFAKGDRTTLKLTRTERDREGEITGWLYASVDGPLFTVQVFND